MWTTLSLAAAFALTAAQPPAAGDLTLSNVRRVYGELGGTRPDAPLLPGDVLTLAFDIEGITVTDDGKAAYTMAMDTLDKSGKTWFKQDPAPLQEVRKILEVLRSAWHEIATRPAAPVSAA